MPLLRLAALVLCVTGGLLTQVTAAPASPGSPRGAWQLIELQRTNGDPVPIAASARYTVRFRAEGGLTARLDCNRGNETYTASGKQVTIRPLSTTRVRCAPGSHGDTFQHLLEEAASYRFNRAGELVLTGNAGTLRLRPA